MALSPILNAESFTRVTKISGLTSNGVIVRVVLEDMIQAEGCKNNGYYVFDVTKESGRILFQLLLTAKANNDSVSVQTNGCMKIDDREYAIVTHVYYCKTQYCD